MMPKPDPSGARGSNSVDPNSWHFGPEIEDRLGSGSGDKATALAIDPADPELLAREIFMTAGQQNFAVRHRDYRTGAMTAAIIALSLLLGWMVGRAGWSMAVNRAEIQTPDVSEVLAGAEASADALPASPNAEESLDDTQSTQSSPSTTSLPNPVPKPKVQAAVANGGLMMFEHGKAAAGGVPSETKPRTESKGKGDEDSQATSDQIPGRATSNYLLRRVVPNYPEQAEKQRVQGPVVLNVLVAKDGSVQDVHVTSGNPELVQAAVEAVKQWQFQPQRVKNNPVEFETQITVNFSLP
jgi:TonB family protein